MLLGTLATARTLLTVQPPNHTVLRHVAHQALLPTCLTLEQTAAAVESHRHVLAYHHQVHQVHQAYQVLHHHLLR